MAAARRRVPVIAPEPNVEQLKLIQAVVDRMAANSFRIKGWTVALVAGLSALSKADANGDFAWIAVGVIIVSAVLDGFYTALERAHQDLFNDVAKGSAAATAWQVEAKVGFWDVARGVCCRLAVLLLYSTLLGAAVAVALTF